MSKPTARSMAFDEAGNAYVLMRQDTAHWICRLGDDDTLAPIRKADVGVAKNYLSADELRELERIVTMYLDYAEDQARRRNPMTMAEWVERLDLFLRFNDREVLADAGKVSHALAAARAQEVYERYDENRSADEARVVSSDFDEMVARRLGREPEGGER